MASLILSESMILEFERIKNSLNAIVSEFDFDSKLLGKPRSAVLLGPPHQFDPILSPTDDDNNTFSPDLSFPDIRKRKKSSDNDRLYKSENDINKLFEILSLKSKAEEVKCAKLNRYSLGSQLEFNDLNSSSETFVDSVKGSIGSFTSEPNITDEDRVEDTPTPQENGEFTVNGGDLFLSSTNVNDSNEDNLAVNNSDGTVNSSGETITPGNQECDAPFVLGRLSEQFPEDRDPDCVKTVESISKLHNKSAASQCDFSDESDLEDYLPPPPSDISSDTPHKIDTLKPEDMSFRSKARMFEVFQVEGVTYKRFKNKPSSTGDIEDIVDIISVSPGEVEPDNSSLGAAVEESAQEICVDFADTSEDEEEESELFLLPEPLNPCILRKNKRVRIKPSHYYIRHPSTVIEEVTYPYIPCPAHTERGGMSATVDKDCSQCAEKSGLEFGTGARVEVMEQARGSTGFLCGLRGSSLSLADSYYQALSPQPCPQTRGYASSMPFLDSEHYNSEKRAARSHSPMSECSRTTNTSRVSLAKRAIHNSHRHNSDDQSQHGSSNQDHIDLSHIMQILTTSTNGKLLSSAAGCLQHMAYNHDHMKARIRDVGGIPILVRLLQAEEEVSLSALGALRNLSYGQQNNINKIAIKDAHGVPLLVQLMKTSDNFEIQELITGVFWNLSSSDQVKPQLLRQALEPIVKSIIIPQSGWKGSQIKHELSGEMIQCTTVFRNATGCLRNLSSAGLDGRQVMRSCYGLVDSLLFVLRCVQGKNDVDNKAVENSVCILRNLSYRLESEVSPEHKYGQVEDWRSRGLGGGQFKRKDPGDEPMKKKKNTKKHKGKENATPLPEHTNGVGLLWQPSVVRVYLDLLLECSNPETLEGAAGTLQNLTACSWEPAQLLREAVRREKGLSVISSLLRMSNDLVVRSIAVCLRNLASDSKNKELLGQNTLSDLVNRLPGGEGADGITDMTIGAIISTILELVTGSPETARLLKVQNGIPRLVDISRSTDVYSGQCVHVSNRVLAACWEIRDLRKTLKLRGWNIGMLQRLPPPDRTDGLEYDETKNQFKASYNDGLNRPHQNTLNRQRSPGRHLSPDRHRSPTRHLSPHHGRRVLSPSGYDHNTHRAATMGRAMDPSLGYHRPERPFEDYDMTRGQSLPARSLPPTHPLNSNYGVADSWV